ncbi:MAG: lipid II flippase MurJ [Patescibacteria group bacterium]
MNFLNGAIYSINAAALLIGAAGLLSRVLGVLRDRLLASEFGASRELDIYYAAFQIPDFLYTVFLLGAASAAIIPVLLELKARDEESARQFMARLIIVFSIGSIAVSVAAFFLMPFLVGVIAPGFSAGDQDLLITLSRIMLVSPVLLGISNILSAAIQSARIFLIYAITGIVYNLGIIIGIIFLSVPNIGS